MGGRENRKIGVKQKKDRLLGRLFTKYPALVKSWAQNAQILKFPDTPWTPFQGQVDRSRLALITTGGIHLDKQAPFNMKDPTGDPSFREIPADTPADHLVITHNYYDHRDAKRDINIIFPLESVQRLKQSGEIGDVNHRHFSFMGHVTSHHVQTLINDTAPRVAAALKRDGVDIVILTPA